MLKWNICVHFDVFEMILSKYFEIVGSLICGKMLIWTHILPGNDMEVYTLHISSITTILVLLEPV